jgi:hypothetical protein
MMNKTSSLFFLSTAQVGERFLEYYKGLGYANILGSPLLDASIPMSFVMSAGMVQFERMAGKKRGGDHFALIQNCFRYFDLERIGESGLHLSLFQMPGAFDFGPVDRQRTVDRILNLLTGIYGLDPACLAVTHISEVGRWIASTCLPMWKLPWHGRKRGSLRSAYMHREQRVISGARPRWRWDPMSAASEVPTLRFFTIAARPMIAAQPVSLGVRAAGTWNFSIPCLSPSNSTLPAASWLISKNPLLKLSLARNA